MKLFAWMTKYFLSKSPKHARRAWKVVPNAYGNLWVSPGAKIAFAQFKASGCFFCRYYVPSEN